MPGLFGVSHGALQFMAYEELKKGYSRYFGTPINKKLVWNLDSISKLSIHISPVRMPNVLIHKPQTFSPLRLSFFLDPKYGTQQ